MSRYFHTLQRLERQRSRAAQEVEDRLPERTEQVSDETPPGEVTPFPELQLAQRQVAYAALLDQMRALASGSTVPRVVIAGVSTAEAMRPVFAGIDARARQQGLRLLTAELVVAHGQRLLRHRLPAQERHSHAGVRGSFAATGEGWAIELTGTPEPESLRDWLEEATAGYDLVVIEAPPVLSSVEASLLGKACDGLVMVVEPMVTSRRALRTATARARASGCPLLGLLVVGARDWLPRWLQRFFDHPPSIPGR